MDNYKKIGWPGHVEDIETDEVIQEGALLSQMNPNHMDDGITANCEAVIAHEVQPADQVQEIKVLKDSVLNSMVNNVFLKNFDTVDSVLIVTGTCDSVVRKIYVQSRLHS